MARILSSCGVAFVVLACLVWLDAVRRLPSAQRSTAVESFKAVERSPRRQVQPGTVEDEMRKLVRTAQESMLLH